MLEYHRDGGRLAKISDSPACIVRNGGWHEVRCTSDSPNCPAIHGTEFCVTHGDGRCRPYASLEDARAYAKGEA